jgi:hypothetical protein
LLGKSTESGTTICGENRPTSYSMKIRSHRTGKSSTLAGEDPYFTELVDDLFFGVPFVGHFKSFFLSS